MSMRSGLNLCAMWLVYMLTFSYNALLSTRDDIHLLGIKHSEINMPRNNIKYKNKKRTLIIIIIFKIYFVIIHFLFIFFPQN